MYIIQILLLSFGLILFLPHRRWVPPAKKLDSAGLVLPAIHPHPWPHHDGTHTGPHPHPDTWLLHQQQSGSHTSLQTHPWLSPGYPTFGWIARGQGMSLCFLHTFFCLHVYMLHTFLYVMNTSTIIIMCTCCWSCSRCTIAWFIVVLHSAQTLTPAVHSHMHD